MAVNLRLKMWKNEILQGFLQERLLTAWNRQHFPELATQGFFLPCGFGSNKSKVDILSL